MSGPTRAAGASGGRSDLTPQAVGRALAGAGLVTSHGGNLSVRDGAAVRITRTRAMLGRLVPGDVVPVPLDGPVPGWERPSSDLPVHRAVYAATDADAIVHAHGPAATALSMVLAGAFEPGDLEGRLLLGRVPVVGDATLDAGAAAPLVAEALQAARVVLLAGHGSYAVGATLEEALNWTSTLEASARVARDARLLGG